MRRVMREFSCFEIPQVAGLSQFLEQVCGLVVDVFRKAEGIAALRYPNGPRLSGPIVDVLKEVMVDGTVMFEIQRPFRERLLGAGARNFRLESIKLGLIPQVELVLEDGRILVGVGIFDRIVHAGCSALAMAGDDGAAIFFGSKALRPLDGGTLFHRIGQMNAFHGADFGKTSAPDHVATGFWWHFSRFLLLGHDHNLA
jgi:hypothetical protein